MKENKAPISQGELIMNWTLTHTAAIAVIATVAASLTYAEDGQNLSAGLYRIESVSKPGKFWSYPTTDGSNIILQEYEGRVDQKWTLITRETEPGVVSLMLAVKESCVTAMGRGRGALAVMLPCNVPQLAPIIRWEMKGGLNTVKLTSPGENFVDNQPGCLADPYPPRKDDTGSRVYVNDCLESTEQNWIFHRLPDSTP